MKTKTWTVGIAVLSLFAASASAQTETSGWSYNDDVQRVAFGGDSCDSCGDGCDCGNGCDDGCGCGDACGAGGCCLGGLSLADALGVDSCWDFGGWTQLGYHSDTTPLSANFDDGLAFNDLPDHLNLHQQWFYLGREADGSQGWDLGGRVDVMYGTDAQKTQAFGNPGAGMRGFGSFDASLDHGYYGWAIPQLYGEVAMGDLSIKVGHFFTLVGYEVVNAPGNFFYSHSLTMFNSEPFTHTGALATYTGFDAITLYGGWTAGWDTGFDNTRGGSNFLGGFSTELMDSVTFTYINTYGNFGSISNGGDDYSHSVVFDVGLTDNMNYVFQSDYKNIDNSDDEDIGINQYLFYSLNDRVKLGGRVEWWRDDQVSHAEATGGVNINVLDNLVFRPEYRKDWLGGFDTDIFGVDAILTY